MERIDKKIMEQENKIKAYKGFNSDMTDVSEKFIDWEQRRFEIAKDLYVRYVDYPHIVSAELDAQHCVKYADILIEALKRGTDKIED